MNTAILSPSGAFAGIGFAIPVDDINRVVPHPIQHGKVVHPRLDVQLATDEVARRLGVGRGALILKVVPMAPPLGRAYAGRGAIKPGVQLGDVLVAIDDRPIEAATIATRLLQRYKLSATR